MADKQSREEVVNKAKEIGKQTEESGKRVGDALTVKLNVDVSEAITGLKAVQREAKEATKALREVEAQSGDISITIDGEAIAESLYKPIRASEFRDATEGAWVAVNALKFFGKRPVTDGGDGPQLYISDKREIFEFTTNELADELAKRKEVAEYLLEDNARATIDFGNGYDAIVNAPVRVYVVADGDRD